MAIDQLETMYNKVSSIIIRLLENRKLLLICILLLLDSLIFFRFLFL